MKTIAISRGRETIVDDEDYAWLVKYTWYCRTSDSGVDYAQTSIYSSATKKQKTHCMSRMILGLADKKTWADHRDGNGLNNQRENLRAVTPRKNLYGFRRKTSGCTSPFRGVSWDPKVNRWRASCARFENGKTVTYYLGGFDTQEAAALAWNKKATELGYFPEALNRVA